MEPPSSSQPQEVARNDSDPLLRENGSSQNLFQSLKNLLRNDSGGLGRQLHKTPAIPLSLTETLESMIFEHAGEQTVISAEERVMLHNMLRLMSMTVSDIMIPRADIIAVEQNASIEEIKAALAEEQHSRLPVYRETLDKLEGFIHLKDIAKTLFSDHPFHLASHIREIIFVPESMKAIDLLLKMRKSSIHIAIVVDEYGGTDGLVTMEDIVEQIVGEIADEHDNEERSYFWINNTMLEADARMELEDLEDCFDEDMLREQDKEGCDTVGGLISAFLGYIPKEGETIDYPTGYRFKVIKADNCKVKRVRVEKRKENNPE